MDRGNIIFQVFYNVIIHLKKNLVHVFSKVLISNIKIHYYEIVFVIKFGKKKKKKYRLL